MTPTSSSRRVMVAFATHDLEAFHGVTTREDAALLLPLWHGYNGMTDDERAEVLAGFPVGEPPTVEGLDYLAAPEVLTGEVTSPFGPCSGLAADKRDNTCTNFAAEYVEWIEGGATNLRRLCAPCADSLPITVSRQPLTRDPGGALVERAS